MKEIRPSPIAGTWYPDDPELLSQSVDEMLAAVPGEAPQGEVLGAIVPHAGHRYSGKVAAHAFRCLHGLQPEVVVVVSPLHQPHPAQVLTSDYDSYWTPLGEIPLDRSALDRIKGELSRWEIPLTSLKEDQEHAVEIELPFLQRVFHHTFRLVPLMIRDQSLSTARALGRSISAGLRGQSTLLIASTDLSHFYPAPAAERFDRQMLHHLSELDPEGLLRAEARGEGFACGRGAAASVLVAALESGADRAEVLHYGHSGHVTGDFSAVVGYCAVLLLRCASPNSENFPDGKA